MTNADESPPEGVLGSTDGQAEVMEPEVTRKSDLASFVLMWFLILSISFLIYRRLKKHNIDLVELFYANLPPF